MNIIHSSSLAFQPAGYLKPDNTALQQHRPKRTAVDDTNNSKRQADQASTPEQIQNALTQAGLADKNDYTQPADIRTAKALAAYSHTRNQSIQVQLSDAIFRLDVYA